MKDGNRPLLVNKVCTSVPPYLTNAWAPSPRPNSALFVIFKLAAMFTGVCSGRLNRNG